MTLVVKFDFFVRKVGRDHNQNDRSRTGERVIMHMGKWLRKKGQFVIYEEYTHGWAETWARLELHRERS